MSVEEKIRQSPNSRFSWLINKAHYTEDYDLLRLLYKIEEYITADLDIIFVDEMEIMEEVVRSLVKLDQEYHLLGGSFVLLNCPPDRAEYMEWFIKLFAHLESLEDEEHLTVEPEDEHYDTFNSKFSPIMFDIDNMKFYYKEVRVLCLLDV